MVRMLAKAVVLAAAVAAAASLGSGSRSGSLGPDLETLDTTIQALQVMQSTYFRAWPGTWPDAIDWTSAVAVSVVAGALDSIAQGLRLISLGTEDDHRVKDNLITSYFLDLVSFFFGQDILGLRTQAYDDMQWVVLGWLDTIRFVNLYNEAHYETGAFSNGDSQKIADRLMNVSWHGSRWIPDFAHRARVFWDLASKGWDSVWCGGGMNWNPRLEPYKNAITNELWIAASISMYLYYPGDNNTSPFHRETKTAVTDGQWTAREPKYLAAAIEGYRWMTTINMTNNRGLYIDGFHMSGFTNTSSNKTSCDEPNKMVYTYNQGVILTGQRGLFQVTGVACFLDDGHRLIRNVIAATGWNLSRQVPLDNLDQLPAGDLPPWRGLGRLGILEEACDVFGECSQDSQAFKGIFMHHLTSFCAPLSLAPNTEAEQKVTEQQFREIHGRHLEACVSYGPWLGHNAAAALATRDAQGRFGSWWTAGLLPDLTASSLLLGPDSMPWMEKGAVDYRNGGVPETDPIRIQAPAQQGDKGVDASGLPVILFAPLPGQTVMDTDRNLAAKKAAVPSKKRFARGGDDNEEHAFVSRHLLDDVHERGRGRSLETQGGGLAVLRAFWELAREPSTKMEMKQVKATRDQYPSGQH